MYKLKRAAGLPHPTSVGFVIGGITRIIALGGYTHAWWAVGIKRCPGRKRNKVGHNRETASSVLDPVRSGCSARSCARARSDRGPVDDFEAGRPSGSRERQHRRPKQNRRWLAGDRAAGIEQFEISLCIARAPQRFVRGNHRLGFGVSAQRIASRARPFLEWLQGFHPQVATRK
jgi:hypothetical protein